MNLENKVAVITGASAGLGKEIAKRLAAEKVKLILPVRNEEGLEKVKKACLANEGAPDVQTFICDLSNVEEVENEINKIKSRVDIVINCAGVYKENKLTEGIADSEKEDMDAVNYEAPKKIIELLLLKLKEQDEASIVNILSRAALSKEELEAAGWFKDPKAPSFYSESKRELKEHTKKLKKELEGTGVQVSGVYPGGIKTDFHKKEGVEKDMENYIDPKVLAEVIVKELSSSNKLRDILMLDPDFLRFV